jgi:hypothetical protein
LRRFIAIAVKEVLLTLQGFITFSSRVLHADRVVGVEPAHNQFNC